MVLQGFAVVNLLFFLVCLFAFMQRKTNWLAIMLVGSSALTGIVSFAGTVWMPQKIVALFCFLYVFYDPGILKRCGGEVLQRCNLVGFCIAISLASAYVLAPSSGTGSSGLQSSFLRPIVQCYAYVSAIGVFAFIVGYATDRDRATSLMAVFFWTVSAAVAVAWIHFVFLKLGRPFLPIPRFGGGESAMAAFGESGTIVKRVYGFSGEPKHLATLILPGIFLQLFYYLVPGDRYISRNIALYALLFTFPVLVLTYSTSAFASLAVGLFIIGTLSVFVRPEITSRLLAISLVGAVVLILAVLFSESAMESMATRVQTRSIQRITNQYDQRLEYKALEYIVQECPEGSLFGLGPGMATYHGIGTVSRRSGVQAMTSTWITMIVDIGVFGTIAFFALLVDPMKKGLSMLRSPYYSAAMAGAFGGFIGAGVAGIATGSLYLVMMFAAIITCLHRAHLCSTLGRRHASI
ncbi:O-antigen ligase family protein [Rhodopirellula sp. P2]|uniref:O-antigen ligase family protein n=1 Tax=Rhodopirellula sp. P2 TaxID=2127060 RepID=UPI002367FD29|nr:hypothetical protein [Rhodopirellula sp. P2]WDQ15658.1 hypothetical protein PSR62_18690 [Rhodopirellula sp. P2]